MRTPDLFERIMERLMRWHDPAADQRREMRYEGTRQRAIAVRRRAEQVIRSYDGESQIVRRRTGR